MMKDIKYFGLILVLFLVLITGCGKKDPDKQLKDAIEKTENAKSATVKFGLNYGIDMQGISFGVSFTGEEDVYKKNEDNVSAHGTYSMKTFGINQSTENYIVQKDGYLYTYFKDENGQWTYSKTEYKKDNEDNDYKGKVIKVLDSATKVKSEKSDKKGYKKLSVTLNIDDVLKCFNEIIPKDSLDEMSEQLDNISMKDVTFTVYIKDGYISVIEIDLEDILKKFTKDLGNEFGQIEPHGVFTISIYDYNNVSEIKVPDEIINNAKEEKMEFDEKDFMNFDVKDFIDFDKMNEFDTKVDF